jgi:hypothetical protein
MMDQRKVQEAMQDGLAFICATCKNWYKGVDEGLKDVEGDAVCLEHKRCSSPLAGGAFEHYDGPMKGHLLKFCYNCGKDANKAIESKGKDFRIGVCSSCLEMLKSRALREPGRRIVFTTERRAGKSRFVEL